MEMIRNWISAICAVSLMTAVLSAITPNGTPASIMRMSCAFLLVIVLVAPIKKIDFDNFSFLTYKMDEIVNEKTENAVRENEKINNDIIESSIREYICKRAEIKEKEVEVIYEDGEIKKIILYTTKKEAVYVIENDLGVKREQIVIRKREE